MHLRACGPAVWLAFVACSLAVTGQEPPEDPEDGALAPMALTGFFRPGRGIITVPNGLPSRGCAWLREAHPRCGTLEGFLDP